MTGPITPADILPPGMLRLGFGCAGLLHGPGPAESLRLLEAAFDCGITYFDTARMYGNGGAEAVLAALAKGRRDRLIIATKAGITPPDRSLGTKALNRGARLMNRLSPRLAKHLRSPAADYRLGMFALPDLRRSLEKSLKELKTDYIDIFLLHECTETDASDGEILGLLDLLVAQGKIRAFGIATSVDQATAIAQSCPELSRIVQVDSNVWNLNIRRLAVRPGDLTITHSTLTTRFRELTSRLRSDPRSASRWKSALGIDALDTQALARLLLAHALHLNQHGAVLFSSYNPSNIRTSVNVAKHGVITAEQIAGLDALIRDNEPALRLEEVHRDYLRVAKPHHISG
ncbi:aldo/keto reductase [Bradyrhizobium symbiodeficiens]|uniref:aldo/keto reductase n=1 Tax=Bradyrhizobium symbiodeficiens TaxID=1404367 RepID=UPI0030D2436F